MTTNAAFVDDANVVVRAEHGCFSGVQGFYEVHSDAVGGPMRFSLFRPGKALRGERVPVLFCLAGLTCTEETFAIKAGAQRVADELGVALLSPDTSPRHARSDGDAAAWDFGVGAGFYLNATQAPWAATYQMETHVHDELRALLRLAPGVDVERCSITGHSMGGHGALSLALRHSDSYRSVSALAPIVAPRLVPWGEKAFSGYLGDDTSLWRAHDTCALIEDGRRFSGPPPLVDQGLADKFLVEQLRPELLEEAAAAAGVAVQLRRHEGYDHGYFFIQSVSEAHVRFHAAALSR
jgi:S-formylglutathione hydrolase